ncbi:putative coiled-coil domain-containing protein 195 [Narcine bancroftii]|uniref:putative coiled-coil domain-containing protein 195 n=1 Tax=Narcine bancroftii TaxID=1343680 RepID=UPI003831AA12
MESNKRLKQMITEMRSEMKKLESENKALRVKLSQNGKRAEVLDLSLKSEEALTHTNLRRNISAPVLEGEIRGNTMTVRRYSISSLHAFTIGNKHHKSPDQNQIHRRSKRDERESAEATPSCTMMKVIKGQGILAELPGANSSEEKHRQDTPFQGYKMKSVTFLLPVDVVSRPEDQDFSHCLGYQSCNQLPPIQEIDF